MRRFPLLLLVATPAGAEVLESSETGFVSRHVAIVETTPTQVFALLGRPERWWSKGHTYSGDSANLSIGLSAGGCFCERLAGGGAVEHGRVVFAQPGKALRLHAALGPLQQEGVSAALTWTLKPVTGGTEVTQLYVVGGHVRGGAHVIAPIIDQVLGEQLKGLQAAARR